VAKRRKIGPRLLLISNRKSHRPLLSWYRPAIPKVRYSESPYCADTRHSANAWVKIRVRVRVSLTVTLIVSGNSRLSE